MGDKQISKSELLAAAQALLAQDDRDRPRRPPALDQPHPDGRPYSLRSKLYFLLKTGLTRTRPAQLPAKVSTLREALVLGAALLLGAAILLLVLVQIRHF